MAIKEEVLVALDLFHENRPQRALEELNRNQMGMFAVMKFLGDTHETVKSVDISKALGMSSARMAVILKKLESKQLIVKTQSETDARAITVHLSEHGRLLCDRLKAEMFATMEKIVDEIGLSELERTFEMLNRAKRIMEENMSVRPEDFYV